MRRSDLKILTIGSILYTQDHRFSPLHEAGSDVWILKVTHSRVGDSGEYECQVSYHDDMEKKIKMPFTLLVLGERGRREREGEREGVCVCVRKQS